MRKFALVSVVGILSMGCFAQDAAKQDAASQDTSKPTVICLAAASGLEAPNWKLQEPVARELVVKSEEKKLNTKIETLQAANEKKGRAEAASKSCDLEVYPDIERELSQFQSGMNPSPYKQDSPVSGRPGQSSTLVYRFKVTDAKGKKLTSDTVKVDMLADFTVDDYNKAGKTLVDKVTEKILSQVPSK